MLENISKWLNKRIETYEMTDKFISKGSSGLEEIRMNIIKALPFWLAGSLAALMATIYAKIFSFVEQQSVQIYQSIGYWYLLAAPLLFFLSWYLVERFSPYANGSGIPQLMAAAELTQVKTNESLTDQLLGFRVIIIKILSSLVAVLGGGAIGREGPTLQISASIFHLVGKYFNRINKSENRYSLLLAGGAAGLASAFNTPLGGIAYAIEELSKLHLSLFRTAVLHSVIVAGLFSQVIMGPYLYFGYPKTGVFEYRLISVVILLALTAGLMVSIFSESLKWLVVYKGTLKLTKHKAIFAGLCGFVFAVFVVFVSPAGLGSGKELLNQILFENRGSTLADVIVRFFGSVATYTSGAAGGIFAPTLSLGGASATYLDGIMGTHLGALATLVGMTAGLSALTHSPLTSFILILEMTDRHSTIFPLMIAAVIGQGISKLISKESFYEFVYERIIGNFIKHESKNEN